MDAAANVQRPARPRGHLLFLLSLPIALMALTSLSAPWTWIGDLCIHFAGLAALALLPVIALVWRSPVRLVVLLFACVAGLWPWGRAMMETRAPLAQGHMLEVATANLYHLNTERGAVLTALCAQPTDLLGVQEVLPDDQAILTRTWPHVVWNSDRQLFSTALFSRHPIVWSLIHDLEGYALVDALVQTPTGMLRVYVVHLKSPKLPSGAAVRARQLRRLAGMIRESAEPVLLLGDLNLSSASPHWRDFASEAGILRPVGGAVGTWPSFLGVLGSDIDHIAGRALALAPLKAITLPGSDHRGLRSSVSLLP